MSNANGYLDELLKSGFIFPQAYSELIKTGFPDITPWWWIELRSDLFNAWIDILHKQFPYRLLIPFAKYDGSDDIACFDGSDMSGNPKVLLIHSFCSPGWENRGEYRNFLEWLGTAGDRAVK